MDARDVRTVDLSDPSQKLWTVDELADYLQVPRRFVLRLNHEGRIRYIRVGRNPRYTDQHVREYLRLVGLSPEDQARTIESYRRREIPVGGV